MSVTLEYENKKQVQNSLPKGTTRSTASQVVYILSTKGKSIDIKDYTHVTANPYS